MKNGVELYLAMMFVNFDECNSKTCLIIFMFYIQAKNTYCSPQLTSNIGLPAYTFQGIIETVGSRYKSMIILKLVERKGVFRKLRKSIDIFFNMC